MMTPVINRQITLKKVENASSVSILKNRLACVVFTRGKKSDARTTAVRASAPKRPLLLINKEQTRMARAKTSNITSGKMN